MSLEFARTADGRNLALLPALANRHGLITGATGTGKTITLQVLTERFSRIGVPVFLADVKGDLSGLAAAGSPSPKLSERLTRLGLEPPIPGGASPVAFWDVFGQSGHPVRATVADMGPLLLGRLLNLNDTQSGVLTLVFKVADDNGLLLLDLKDLRAMLQFAGEHGRQFTTEYGNISVASVGAIQRALLALEDQGGDRFFGEPMLDIQDLLQTSPDGRGIVNILAADRLMQSPKVYATFLLWVLAELFEQLPEAGDPEKPKLVFFFDEAHLLFTDAPAALVEKIEQVVRLIRSKGVGVYFVTQNPLDVPDRVLSQLGNRVQHALRAFTPRDQKAVRTAAETLRANPAFDAEAVITELAVGEGLVSCLDEHGTPAMVERAWILPPASRIGPVTPDERRRVIAGSLVGGHYEKTVDRASAYETLSARATARLPDEATADAPTADAPMAGRRMPGPSSARPPGSGSISDLLFGTTGPRGGKREGILESAARSAARSVGSGVGRQILRGVLGSIPRPAVSKARHIVLACWGSYGDLFLYLALAARLRDDGHQPIVATAPFYRDLVERLGLVFHPMRPDLDPLDTALLARVMDPARGGAVVIGEVTAPAVRDAFEDLSRIVKTADLLVSHPITFAAPLAAEAHGVRWLSSVLAPTSFFSRHDFPVLPPLPPAIQIWRKTPWASRAFFSIARRITRPWTAPVRALRAELGLRDTGEPLYEGQFSPHGTIALFSSLLATPQADWPPASRVTGFAFHDDDSPMPIEVERFLDAGEPPVVFTLGTLAAGAAGSFYRESFEAARLLGRRALLLVGRQERALLAAPLPKGLLAAEYAPHQAVFPRSAAIVHHGGVGTTARALASGRPMLVVPHSHDQPDNADRVERLGVARVLDARRYRARRAAGHLDALLTDPRHQVAANRARDVIATEDGAVAAADAIARALRS